MGRRQRRPPRSGDAMSDEPTRNGTTDVCRHVDPHDEPVRSADVDAAVAVRIDLPSRRRDANIRGVTAGTNRRGADHRRRSRRPDRLRGLHRRYARSVLGIALRQIGDRGRAEDATGHVAASGARRHGSTRRAARRRHGCTRSRGTPSSTRSGVGASRRSTRRRRSPTRPRPRRRRGAGLGRMARPTVPSMSSQSRSGLVELAYWGGLSQRDRRVPEHPVGNRQDAYPVGAPPSRRRAGGRALMSEPRDLRDLIGDDMVRTSSSGSSACTRCWSRQGRPRSCRRLAHAPEPPSARVIPFPRRYRYRPSPRPRSRPSPCSAWATWSPAGRRSP